MPLLSDPIDWASITKDNMRVTCLIKGIPKRVAQTAFTFSPQPLWVLKVFSINRPQLRRGPVMMNPFQVLEVFQHTIATFCLQTNLSMVFIIKKNYSISFFLEPKKGTKSKDPRGRLGLVGSYWYANTRKNNMYMSSGSHQSEEMCTNYPSVQASYTCPTRGSSRESWKECWWVS